MKRIFTFLLAISAFSIIVSCNTEPKSVEPLQILSAAGQDLEVYSLEDLPSFLETTDEKVHVVNFWATWCGPCIKELPYFEEINEEMAENVKVTLISIDKKDDIEKRLVSFVNKKDLKSDIIVIPTENEEVNNIWPTINQNWDGGIPVTIIYNKNKSKFIGGSLSKERLLTEIENFKL